MELSILFIIPLLRMATSRTVNMPTEHLASTTSEIPLGCSQSKLVPREKSCGQ